MTCSTSVQNCKNYGDHKIFIPRVQTEQINSVSDNTYFIQLLLNDYHYCKFHIFFDIEIWCVPITQTIVQSFDITMEQSLSKVEL
jgi:hypothetical protein